MDSDQSDIAALREKLAQIEQAISALQQSLQSLLPKDEFSRLVNSLYEQRAKLQNSIVSVPTLSLGSENITVGERSVFVGGNVHGSVLIGNIGNAVERNQDSLTTYLNHIIATIDTYLFQDTVSLLISSQYRSEKKLQFSNLYVDLDSNVPLSSLTLEQQHKYKGKYLSLLDAIYEYRHLVLLGTAGSGKSTFINYIAYNLALRNVSTQFTSASNQFQQLIDEKLIPIVIRVIDLALYLKQNPMFDQSPNVVWSYIKSKLEKDNLEFAEDALRQALETGNVFLFFDGLDEVASSIMRIQINILIQAFATRYPKCHVLITCRITAYQPPTEFETVDLRLPTSDFPHIEVAAFSESKIKDFIANWYKELARLGIVNNSKVGLTSRRLIQTIEALDLEQLAKTPLLLMVIVLVHNYKGYISSKRAILFEDIIEILLWQWEQKKANDSKTLQLTELLIQAQLTDKDLRKALSKLSYEMYEQLEQSTVIDDMLLRIGELKLEKTLAFLKGNDRNWASDVIKAIKTRSGLLVEREPEVFTFPHRSFQDYMVATHLSSVPDFVRRCTELLDRATWWKDIIILACERIITLQGDLEKPLNLAAELIFYDDEIREFIPHKIWVAADILAVLGVERVKESSLASLLLKRIRGKIQRIVTSCLMLPLERASCIETLYRIGDERAGIGICRIIDGIMLPDLQFSYIPRGAFLMGSDTQDSNSEDEHPLHEVLIDYGYFVSVYPVTVCQFEVFMKATSYKLIAKDSLYAPGNHPVVWVTMDDALAYCRWINEMMRAKTDFFSHFSDDTMVTIPSEAEWEKAARGGLEIPEKPLLFRGSIQSPHPDELRKLDLIKNPIPSRKYPWGQNIDIRKANYSVSGINRTCPVGIFTEGISPYGLLDMSGNVWEWTRSEFKSYRYDATDGRESLRSKRMKTMRGGSFFNESNFQTVSCRWRNGPTHFGNNRGFRVIIGPVFL